MTNKINKAGLALIAGLFLSTSALTPVYAADLGGDCCADLEERVAELESTTVRKGNRKVSLSLSGHINRAMLIWSADLADGTSDSDIYSVGEADSQSRFRMKGSAKIGSGWSAGFLLEYWVNDTLSNTVSQDNDDGATDGGAPTLRQDFVYLQNVRLGRLSLGHISDSTDGIAEIDLSGTKVVNKFSDAALWNGGFDMDGSAHRWGNVISHVDGITSVDAVRYDTPTYRGFTASATFGEDDLYSVAVRYAGEFNGVMKIAGGIGYLESDGDTGTNFSDREQLSGSITALHTPTGLNVAFSMGQRDRDTAVEKDSYWHIKAGIKQRWSRLGVTALYGEYAEYDMNNTGIGGGAADGIEADMWGLGVVQHIDAAAMEIYAAYRMYDASNDAQWSGAMLGARIKF